MIPAAEPAPAEPAPTELAGTCDDTQAQWIIGKTAGEKEIEQAKTDSKSEAVRALKPGDAATMDFNPNRLNIILDEKGAVIRPAKLWCDTSTVAECALLTKKFGGEKAVIRKAGLAFCPGSPPPRSSG